MRSEPEQSGVLATPPPECLAIDGGVGDDGAPPEGRRRHRWRLSLGAIVALVLGVVVVAAGVLIRLPYQIFSPGNPQAVLPLVSIGGAPTYDSEGMLYFTTVSVQDRVSPILWLWAKVTPNTELVPRPPGTDAELSERNAQLMDDSIATAEYVALSELGYEDVSISGDGTRVEAILDGFPADGVLEVGDVIVAADGTSTPIQSELGNVIRGREVGQEVTLTVRRGDDEFDVVVGTAESPTDGAPIVGIETTTVNQTFEFPVDIELEPGAVGGPSAGLMFTLAIIDRLTEEDLTGGYEIAGTGSMSLNGSVGAIGGVSEKVVGAVRIGADYFLAPLGNAEAAVQAAGDDIVVIPVGSIDDALAALEDLPAAA